MKDVGLFAKFEFEKQPWVVRAACRGEPTEKFFPGPGKKPDDGLKICATCPVRSNCGQYAQLTDQEHGIWGGEQKKRHKSSNGSGNDDPSPPE